MQDMIQDAYLKFLASLALIAFITDTGLTIIWKTFGNGRDK